MQHYKFGFRALFSFKQGAHSGDFIRKMLIKCEIYMRFIVVFEKSLLLQQFFTTITYQERLREMDL